MTVADLKRRIKPGVKIQSVFTSTSFGNPTDPFYNEVGTVVRVMSTEFTINRPFKGPKSESYCSFPKASELFETENGFRIVNADTELEYKWVKE